MADDEPFMSSDGSDTDGSLAEFIQDSDDGGADDGVEPAIDDNPEDEAQTLAQELTPEERALMEQKTEEGQPRRSRRARKAPVRYVDDKYAELMLTRGGAADLDDVMAPSSDEELPDDGSDDDFEAGSEGSGDETDDEEEEDYEEEEEEDASSSSGKRPTPAGPPSPRKRARSAAE